MVILQPALHSELFFYPKVIFPFSPRFNPNNPDTYDWISAVTKPYKNADSPRFVPECFEKVKILAESNTLRDSSRKP